MTVAAPIAEAKPNRYWRFAKRNPTIVLGASLLLIAAFLAVIAPLISADPRAMQPIKRLQPPSEEFWFGTDHLGRDVFSRTMHGAQISLMVGFFVSLGAVGIGLLIGLIAGYYRALDSFVMRIMDGMMAIPGILLAIALVSLNKASIAIVIIAIVIPEIPRVVRLVRSVVLITREQPFIEAAVSGGSQSLKIIRRHILPSTIAPLIVQSTYIAASAILIEAALSFLGVGVPPEIPT
jgi:peptide/nickel transport system permease protein